MASWPASACRVSTPPKTSALCWRLGASSSWALLLWLAVVSPSLLTCLCNRPQPTYLSIKASLQQFANLLPAGTCKPLCAGHESGPAKARLPIKHRQGVVGNPDSAAIGNGMIASCRVFSLCQACTAGEGCLHVCHHNLNLLEFTRCKKLWLGICLQCDAKHSVCSHNVRSCTHSLHYLGDIRARVLSVSHLHYCLQRE